MYQITCNKSFEVQLEVPSFVERYSTFLRKSGKKKVVYFKNEFDNSTFRYRCYNFCEALDNSANFEIVYFLCKEIPRLLPHLSSAAIIVLQRASWTPEVDNLIHLAKHMALPVVYDMDDLLYKIDYVPQYLNHIGTSVTQQNIRLYLSLAAAYQLVAAQCDLFLTTTSYLAERLRADFGRDVYIVPNFMNHEQLSVSEEVLQTRVEDPERFVIGYFSGSLSHKMDFRVAQSAILRLMDKYDDVDLKIVGYMGLEESLRRYKRLNRLIFRPLVPYQELQYEIGSVDVNIIPLSAIGFNDAKSELKFFEAGAVQVPSCMSPADIYRSCVTDGENGLLCGEGDWYNALERLYLDVDLRQRLALSAYKKAHEVYTPERQTDAIEKVYHSILSASEK